MTESHKNTHPRPLALNMKRFAELLLYGAVLNGAVVFLYFYLRELPVPEWLAFIYQTDDWFTLSGRALFFFVGFMAVGSFFMAIAHALRPHFGWAVIFFVLALAAGEIIRNSLFLLAG
jgi:hypothetical protein